LLPDCDRVGELRGSDLTLSAEVVPGAPAVLEVPARAACRAPACDTPDSLADCADFWQREPPSNAGDWLAAQAETP